MLKRHVGEVEVDVERPSDGGPAELPEVIAVIEETSDVP
jgi:hypothetical protein